MNSSSKQGRPDAQDTDKDVPQNVGGTDGQGTPNGRRDGARSPQKGKAPSRLPLIIGIAVLVLCVVGGATYSLATRNQETTDDAYTEGNAISIAPKVVGYVVENRINDNTIVRKGELLLRIDPRDYVAARDQAKANLDAALALKSSAGNDLDIARVRAPANLVQARSQLTQAQANRTQAQRDFDRQHGVDPRATTQTSVDQSTTALRSTEANIDAAKAQVSIASLVQQTIRTASDTLQQRQAEVEQARANLAQAELNLSYTEIRAPQDGRITRRNVDFGTFVQAGQQVFFIVTHDLWVTANYKETQLDRMQVGQRVDIKVDAYPGLDLSGHIESIQSGSGARFSAFPAENATGNFVKIVRRVPVKIVVDRGLKPGASLPIGLSVTPTVNLK